MVRDDFNTFVLHLLRQEVNRLITANHRALLTWYLDVQIEVLCEAINVVRCDSTEDTPKDCDNWNGSQALLATLADFRGEVVHRTMSILTREGLAGDLSDFTGGA
jgi:hypothetical protein